MPKFDIADEMSAYEDDQIVLDERCRSFPSVDDVPSSFADVASLTSYLNSLRLICDTEIRHEMADRALLNFIGSREVSAAFASFKKWYA